MDMPSIRIHRTPAGEAPQHIRQAGCRELCTATAVGSEAVEVRVAYFLRLRAPFHPRDRDG
jgi:hypothetical protein